MTLPNPFALAVGTVRTDNGVDYIVDIVGGQKIWNLDQSVSNITNNVVNTDAGTKLTLETKLANGDFNDGDYVQATDEPGQPWYRIENGELVIDQTYRRIFTSIADRMTYAVQQRDLDDQKPFLQVIGGQKTIWQGTTLGANGLTEVSPDTNTGGEDWQNLSVTSNAQSSFTVPRAVVDPLAVILEFNGQTLRNPEDFNFNSAGTTLTITNPEIVSLIETTDILKLKG